MSILDKIKSTLSSKPPSTKGINHPLFDTLLPENAVILEAGACSGDDTIPIAKKFPKSTVFAFEPDPRAFATLSSRVREIPNVKIFPIALSEKTGLMTLHLSSGGSLASNSLLVPKEHLTVHPGVQFSEKVEVQTMNLDEWAALNDVKQIHFMYLDMQGYELFMLKGSPKIFGTVKLLYTEVSLIETYAGVPLYHEYKEWLLAQGFEVIQEELAWKDMGNVLFARK